jgi:predicted transposase/invertase (TIGR01784 family)
VDHRLWEGDGRYHHRFRLYDPEAGLEYPNLLEIHTLELPKLPEKSDGSALWEWLKFISSETRDEFAALAGKDAVMAEVVGRLLELSDDEAARLRAEAREKWLWDYYSGMRHSREEGLAEGLAKGQAAIIRRMLAAKMPLETIADLAECTIEEVTRLAEECGA